MMIIGALAVIVFAYWFLSTSLSPVEVPPLVLSRKDVKFDPKVDMSKNAKFLRLKPLGDGVPELTGLGRSNPFLPYIVATGTAPSVQKK